MPQCDHCRKETQPDDLYDFTEYALGRYCGRCQADHHCPRCDCSHTVPVGDGSNHITCPVCDGKGLVFDDKVTCPVCDGRAKESEGG